MSWKGDQNEKKNGKTQIDVSEYEKGVVIDIPSGTKYTSSLSLVERIGRRKLLPRQVSMIGIGGAIGTALFVSIGSKIIQGGPASLLIAFCLWSVVFIGLSQSMCVMVTYLPVTGSFVHFTERFVDESISFSVGWTYFVCQAANVCFEITAVCLVIEYWTDQIPKAAIISILIVVFAALNLYSVFFFGEGEFYLSLGKVILALGLILFTIIVMCGGNPHHEVLGFKYWKNPGAFAEYLGTGSIGKFHGFMACLVFALYVFWGVDYLGNAASEAMNPRKVIPRAFKKVFGRLIVFYIGGAICVGVLIPYNDSNLIKALNEGATGAGASPYVSAMTTLGIRVLPHIVNVLILSSIISAGNSSLYSASRVLHRLALEGHAPAIFKRITRRGVPIYCCLAVLIICCLAYLACSNSTNNVLTWFLNVETGAMAIVYIFICVCYLRFEQGCKTQGLDIKSLPYSSKFLPYLTWHSLFWLTLMLWVSGYTVFLRGNWNFQNFVFSYFMIPFFIILFVVHKFVRKTKFVKAETMDLTTGLDQFAEEDEYWAENPPKLNWFDKAFGKFL
ncbi:general amino acid permease AGP2 [Schizosaccharomyces japonicus yFS275]|uniref:General amino acid permease AGP2 n=1 Tax=Schizosaccharomyces japonicus (strain yFS275 / FY16936) TaxID=402676 RepID=B6K2Y0_SCHJY|nr:general amino acid permease AGP2 [Schizosaccharomyces japonicus yFS275]EEB07837.1 general amino acid permease AGP2 [Schizosaccharomyces japonicus yFS275]